VTDATGVAGVSRADVCVVACAEAWRGDGEIFASGMGTIPMLGARLARASFEPDLMVSDGEAYFVSGDLPVGAGVGDAGAVGPAGVAVEGWIPFRTVFDTLWGGRRHVMMGASQMDRTGNQNIACIGPWAKPKAMLLGMRGAPGNTANHTTSYWIANHGVRVFVDQVDVVSGLGYERAASVGGFVAAHHELRRVVTNLAVLDFETPSHTMRLRSVHPGVTVDEVVAATGFALALPDDDSVPESRLPTPEELQLLDEVLDPAGLRHQEVR
jgi:acyl CoA:acetate/3-ketoacid CoA transferase beta subunit